MRRSSTEHAATIHDIARAAGVSKTTVSRVVNGSPDVSDSTRSRVLEAVAQLGYQVNTAARTLRTSRSALVGLLVPGLHEVFAEIAQQLDKELRDHGMGMLMTISEWDADRDIQGLESLRSRGVDAVVASLTNDRTREIASYLKSFDRPIILLDREVRGVTYDAVLTDQRPGVSAALQHLWDLGHRTIGLVSMSMSTRPGRENITAYAKACQRLGLEVSPDLIYQSDHFDRRAGRDAASRLLSAGARAIMALGPMSVVAGVLEQLDDVGLKVPNDVSVIGYDENELAFVKQPRMTVIGRPVDELGRLAGKLVMSRLSTPDAPRRVEVVQTRLVVHESSGPASESKVHMPVSPAIDGVRLDSILEEGLHGESSGVLNPHGR
jgi:LacI family transcriptional regulator